MTDHEAAVCRCRRCGHRFRVLADEYGDHPCPKCGWHPEQDREGEGDYVEKSEA